jgi:glycosyltransferase involved in cell wall biosynthesis
MKISVIIPVYNCEKYLERCLDSVLRQRLDDGDELQIVTVDDGSTDSSGSILDRYAKVHSNIQVLHQPNQGVSAARNHGIDLVEGDYIHFVDADDFLLYDNCYRVLLQKIKNADTPIDILRFKFIMFFEGNELDVDRYYNLDDFVIDFEGTGRDVCHELKFIGYAHMSLNRSDVIREKHLRFDTTIHFNEDTLFNLELYLTVNHVVLTTASIYGYYMNSGSVSFSNDKKRSLHILDNLFNSIPKTVSAIDSYNDPQFKNERLESMGYDISSKLLKVDVSLNEMKKYLKRGFDEGIFPIGRARQDWFIKLTGWLQKRPILFWLANLGYRKVFLPYIKPLVLQNGYSS